MDNQKIYNDIVIAFFNIIKNEKLRTKIALNSEYKDKVVTLVCDLLALEKDHNCTFKNSEWSSVYAKSVVNITKEKIIFKKSEGKTTNDIYADYADILTVSMNLYDVKREVLTDSLIDITAEEIKLNSKVTITLKEMYAEKTAENPKIEVVDQSKEIPNINNNTAGTENAFNQSQFANTNNPIPVPPIQNPRFYPYKTKPNPKHIKQIKFAFGIIFAFLGILYIIFQIWLSTQTVLVNRQEYPGLFDNWNWLTSNSSQEIQNWNTISFNVMLAYTPSINPNLNWLFIIVVGFSITFVAYSYIRQPRQYREQFIFPWRITLFSIFVTVMIGFRFVYPQLWRSLTNSEVVIHENIGLLFRRLIENNFSAGPFPENFDASINAIFSTIFLETVSLSTVNTILWLEFSLCVATAALIILIIVINPRLDRQKLVRANQEWQKYVSEAMQGRKYNVDESLFESESEINKFNDNKKSKNKDNKDNKE